MAVDEVRKFIEKQWHQLQMLATPSQPLKIVPRKARGGWVKLRIRFHCDRFSNKLGKSLQGIVSTMDKTENRVRAITIAGGQMSAVSAEILIIRG